MELNAFMQQYPQLYKVMEDSAQDIFSGFGENAGTDQIDEMVDRLLDRISPNALDEGLDSFRPQAVSAVAHYPQPRPPRPPYPPRPPRPPYPHHHRPPFHHNFDIRDIARLLLLQQLFGSRIF